MQGRQNTMRSTLTIGYPLRVQRRQMHRRITPGIPPFLAVASIDRMQQGIWGWPVQSPRHLQELILPQKPHRKQKKRAINDRLLEWERQPHSDFFVNLSEDVEDELDFSEDRPADLSQYDQYFEWDEAEYMRLRFTAARHYASRGHWTDAYAYVLRTCPDNIPQHEDTYNKNAQAWHYTNARINELIQEVERILETQDRQMPEGIQFGPPRDSLIPPVHSTEALSSVRGIQREEQESKELPETTFTRRVGGQGGRAAFKLPHSPNQESQREERDSVIDAVKQITGAQTETPGQGRMTVGDTPEYLWDTGYDGIQGFASRLRNRVSETSTPQSGQSPKGRPKTPPEPQRQFKQLKVYDETPTGRPLPTLQQIRQANLPKILEEEGVDMPCDICGSPHHDYRNCTKEAYRESQDVRQSFAKGRDSEGQCPNCNIPHPGICPCAWCDQPGHIAQDCMAHFADDSMRARFPKREKVRRTPIKYYECRRCGGSHPFNIYCPNVRDPPVIPGECRSCGATTREHANDCQYVAIKDNIGLCTYCQAQDHRYADCPQWALDREAVVREAKRNKKNKKRGKVKIVAGIMTREQESDSTLSPERGEGGVERLSPQKSDGRQDYQRPLHGGYLPQPVIAPKEVMCSFCGGNSHDYRDCPTMHQYIREQADALAQRRMGEYQQPREWEGYETPRQIPSYQGPYFRGGGPDEEGLKSGQGPSRKETQKQKIPTKSGEPGSAYPHSTGGMAPGGGGGSPPPSRGGPPDDRRDDESDKEEDEEEDTDEETESVTSSSQVSAHRG